MARQEYSKKFPLKALGFMNGTGTSGGMLCIVYLLLLR